MSWDPEIMRREDGAPHPAFGHPLPARGERALPPSDPSPRLRGEGGAQRRMRGAILTFALLLVTWQSASAATLRDNVRDPAKIQALFPKTAKLRVVNVWATWCVPCVAEMPELRKTAAVLGADAAFVGVSMDDMIPDSKPAKVAAFLDRQKIGYIN